VKHVIDASVVLAVCQQEAGSEQARLTMRAGLISTVNLSEVFQKSMERHKLPQAKAIVETAGLEIVPFSETLAEIAAEIHSQVRGKDISFADRACLALGMAEGLPVLTGDHAWTTLPMNITVELFRAGPN